MEIAVCTRTIVTDRFTADGRRIRRERLAEDIPVAKTDKQIRRKWLEILGGIFAPGRRHPAHMKFQHAAVIVKAWRPLWRDLWEAVENDSMSVTEAWTALTSDGTIHTDLPMIQGLKPTVETFPWGPGERKLYGLAYVPEPPQLDSETLAVQATSTVENRLADGTIVTRALKKLDSAALGLSATDMKIITDPTIERPVDYTMPVSESLIVQRV